MTSIILKDLPKTGGLESANLYILNTPVFYAAVHEVKKKFQSEDREYSLTAFIDEETKDKLLDEVMVNKTFAQVGITKTSKPPRRIKYPLSSQVEEGKVNYDAVDGLWGFNLAKPEFSKKGNLMSVNVIDKEGNPFTDNIGNGSVVTLKLFGYRNQDGQLVVTLDTVQVVEHVAYEGKTSSDEVVDDVMGSYKVKKVDAKPVADEKEATVDVPAAKSKAKPAPLEIDEEEDPIPF